MWMCGCGSCQCHSPGAISCTVELTDSHARPAWRGRLRGSRRRAERPLFEAAFAPFAAELRELLPADGVVVDAHTHLGLDEDGRSLDLERAARGARRGRRRRARVRVPAARSRAQPAYRRPNDRVLAWAARERRAAVPVLPSRSARGSGRRGGALPRARRARDQAAPARAGVRLRRARRRVDLRGRARRRRADPDPRRPWDAADGRRSPTSRCAFPEVPLILAHAAIADQGMFAIAARRSTRRSSTTPPASRRSTSRAVRARPGRADRVRLRHPLRPAARRAAPRRCGRRLRRPGRARARARRRRDDGGARRAAGRWPSRAPARRRQSGPSAAACARVSGYLLMRVRRA